MSSRVFWNNISINDFFKNAHLISHHSRGLHPEAIPHVVDARRKTAGMVD
jgi:hypothetical protein